MKKLAARWLQFWHCLRYLHRSEHAWWSGKGLTYLGCECGRVFYGERPWFLHPRASKKGQ